MHQKVQLLCAHTGRVEHRHEQLYVQDKDQVGMGQSMCEELNHHYRNCRIFIHLGFHAIVDNLFAGMTMAVRFEQTLRQLLLPVLKPGS